MSFSVTLPDTQVALERLAVDLTAVEQRVTELDRRVTALHLLIAADDARHVEQAIVDAAAAANDLHKVITVLGGPGLLDELRERTRASGDAMLQERRRALETSIQSTRQRVARSSLLTSSTAALLEKQLQQVLGTQADGTGMYDPSDAVIRRTTGPRLVDRLA